MRIASAIDFRPMGGEQFVAVAAFVAAAAAWAAKGERDTGEAAAACDVNEHCRPQTSIFELRIFSRPENGYKINESSSFQTPLTSKSNGPAPSLRVFYASISPHSRNCHSRRRGHQSSETSESALPLPRPRPPLTVARLLREQRRPRRRRTEQRCRCRRAPCSCRPRRIPLRSPAFAS